MEHIITDKETKTQSIVDAFIDMLDSLFYQGYAMKLAEESPELYQFELNNFLDNYSF